MEQRTRRALITASTSGIGYAVAQDLLRRGAQVTVHGRTRGSATAAAEKLDATVESLHGDVSRPDEVRTLAAQVDAGHFDVLVHCAGPYAEHTHSTATPADWQSAYQTNVVSAVQLATAALAPMRDRGFGRVVFIGTRATRTPIPTMIEYSAAKAALANATISLARTAVAPGVTVNMVSPGVILTPAMQRLFASRPESAGRSWDEIEASLVADYAPNPQQRLGRAEEIAALVGFLSTDAAGYINGADIPVDGGITGTH
ncbi:3-oxoacyl-ACP reductase [Flexivirga endophytica]|uniref:3-oxoacyl-ACP reductase n=1 Tax=Flexivirga endophytica TaxID=1849103 RepID=A0A916SSV1_9MICO|nr:SDR family oxidoreductase [Flexivirga endophytica]GGB16066.1 3-oxoacyl-ACP reductase [Flexivirga endophytica]GHB39552.1 3-oxoacyl-ACP reductase [Flexivirga endophytica]